MGAAEPREGGTDTHSPTSTTSYRSHPCKGLVRTQLWMWGSAGKVGQGRLSGGRCQAWLCWVPSGPSLEPSGPQRLGRRAWFSGKGTPEGTVEPQTWGCQVPKCPGGEAKTSLLIRQANLPHVWGAHSVGSVTASGARDSWAPENPREGGGAVLHFTRMFTCICSVHI